MCGPLDASLLNCFDESLSFQELTVINIFIESMWLSLSIDRHQHATRSSLYSSTWELQATKKSTTSLARSSENLWKICQNVSQRSSKCYSAMLQRKVRRHLIAKLKLIHHQLSISWRICLHSISRSEFLLMKLSNIHILLTFISLMMR